VQVGIAPRKSRSDGAASAKTCAQRGGSRSLPAPEHSVGVHGVPHATRWTGPPNRPDPIVGGAARHQGMDRCGWWATPCLGGAGLDVCSELARHARSPLADCERHETMEDEMTRGGPKSREGKSYEPDYTIDAIDRETIELERLQSGMRLRELKRLMIAPEVRLREIASMGVSQSHVTIVRRALERLAEICWDERAPLMRTTLLMSTVLCVLDIAITWCDFEKYSDTSIEESSAWRQAVMDLMRARQHVEMAHEELVKICAVRPLERRGDEWASCDQHEYKRGQ
jgi:hypothetical protein